MSVPISVAILTKNEERALPTCLASLTAFEDVYVVDSDSTDGTRAVAEAAGAHVVDFRWNGAYPKKKQWSLDHVAFRFPHVLLLDADERLTPALVQEMTELAASGRLDEVDAADIQLDYVWAGRFLRHGHKVLKRALVRRTAAAFPEVPDLSVSNMWEVEGHYQPIVSGNVVRLAGRIVHDDPDGPYEYFSRHNRYSDWEAWIATDEPAAAAVGRARRRGATRLGRIPFKPLVFFLYSYVLKGGFLDGRAGLDYALAHAFYYWQVGLKIRMAGDER
jgi:glycosyltransferase involved in cell wall biosynthesis